MSNSLAQSHSTTQSVNIAKTAKYSEACTDMCKDQLQQP